MGLCSHNFKEILVQLWIIDVNFKFLCGNLPGDYIKSFAQHQCCLCQVWAMGFWKTKHEFVIFFFWDLLEIPWDFTGMQNGRHFPDDIFKCISLNENVWIPIKISLKFVPKVRIKNIPALV